MKQFIKMGVLSIALIASLLLLTSNKTHAAAGQVSFSITWGVSNAQCVYGTSWVMGQYPSSLSAFTASGLVSNFACTDTQGLSSWSMTLQETTPVTNGLTSIAATGVSMQATLNQVTNGSCTIGTNTTSMTQIGSTPWTIMAKAGAVNYVCTIATTWVTLNVAVPAAATVGSYSWTLSLSLPW